MTIYHISKCPYHTSKCPYHTSKCPYITYQSVHISYIKVSMHHTSKWPYITHQSGHIIYQVVILILYLQAEKKSKDIESGGSGGGLCSRILLQSFTLTFLAEWGDRSQITTIILGAREVRTWRCWVGSFHLVCRGTKLNIIYVLVRGGCSVLGLTLSFSNQIIF